MGTAAMFTWKAYVFLEDVQSNDVNTQESVKVKTRVNTKIPVQNK